MTRKLIGQVVLGVLLAGMFLGFGVYMQFHSTTCDDIGYWVCTGDPER